MSTQAHSLEYESEYRSSIAPRTATGRASMGRSLGATTPTGGGRVLKIVTEMGSQAVSGISPAMSANAAQSFVAATEREKKEMQNLNERLGKSAFEKLRKVAQSSWHSFQATISIVSRDWKPRTVNWWLNWKNYVVVGARIHGLSKKNSPLICPLHESKWTMLDVVKPRSKFKLHVYKRTSPNFAGGMCIGLAF